MLETGQLWMSRTNANRVLIREVKDGDVTWSDMDNEVAVSPAAALEFKLEADFELAPFKISPQFKARRFFVMSTRE